MSLSDPSKDSVLVNPASRFYEWVGKIDAGHFKYYNKADKSNVTVPLPFTFIPLDTLITLKGYNKKKLKGFWSNEVRDISTDKFTIKSKDGIEMQGLYKELKDFCELNKISYIQSVYIAYKNEKGHLTLGNIQIKTSALTPWIELTKSTKPYGMAITVKSTTKGRNGDVDFLAPVYQAVILKEETKKEAIKLDEVLQEYLNTYLKRTPETVVAKSENAMPKEAKKEVNVDETLSANNFDPDDDDTLPF